MIDLIAVFFIIWSFIDLIWSGTNRKRSVCILLLILDLVGAAYLFIDLLAVPELLNTPSGTEELGIGLLAFLAFFVYLISLIINIVKLMKYSSQTVTAPEKRRNLLVITGMLIIPVAILSFGTLRDYYRIRNCDAIVTVISRRNTHRLLDNESFGYVIKGDKVHRFDLMLTAGLWKIIDEDMVPGEKNDALSRAKLGEYEAFIINDDVHINHNGETLFIYVSYPEGFYNNNLTECYYRQ